MIMLDSFTSDIFSEIIKEDISISTKLQGFTYFRNTISNFPWTGDSVPAIFSGRIDDHSVPSVSYMKDVWGKTSLPVALSQNGFQVDLVTLPIFCRFAKLNCAPIEFMGRSQEEIATLHNLEAIKILDIVFFRFAPHFAKKNCVE